MPNMSSVSHPPTKLEARPDFLTELRARQARSIHRSYYAWLRLSRLAAAGFVVMAVLFLIWTVPWLPSGLSTEDYTPEVAFTLYLVGGTTLLGTLALVLRTVARRRQATLMAWSAVYDQRTGLYNRTYLYNLLALECDRASELRSAFSLLVFQLRPAASGAALSPTALQTLAELIRRSVRSTDVVGLLSENELAVLALELGRKQRTVLLRKVRSAIVAALPTLLGPDAGIGVMAGAATYGAEGEEPGSLIQAARSAAADTVGRTRAA